MATRKLHIHLSDVELAPVSDHYTIKELWKKVLKPNRDRVAEPLLASVVGHLAAQHHMLCAWQEANREWNPASHGRSAIEPHEQDKYPKAVDVLIDAARDCLEWLALNRPQTAAQWCDQLAGAETPLLRRLAVHTLSVRKDLTPSEKIDWLLARMDLHDLSVRHELFRVLQQTYPEAESGATKGRYRGCLGLLLAKTKKMRTGNVLSLESISIGSIGSIARRPSCILAREALYAVLRRYPDFKTREHPDLTYWISSDSGGHQSPWTVEELLSQPAEKWAEKLLSFQQTEVHGPDRIGIGLTTFRKRQNRNSNGDSIWRMHWPWEGDWDTDLWSAL